MSDASYTTGGSASASYTANASFATSDYNGTDDRSRSVASSSMSAATGPPPLRVPKSAQGLKAVHYYHNQSYHSDLASCRTPTATAVTWEAAVDEATTEAAMENQQQRIHLELLQEERAQQQEQQLQQVLNHYDNNNTRIDYDHGEGQELQLSDGAPATTTSSSIFCYQGLNFAKHVASGSSPAGSSAAGRDDDDDDNSEAADAQTVVADNLKSKKETQGKSSKKGLSFNMKSMVHKLAKRVLPATKEDHGQRTRPKEDKMLQTPPRVFSHATTPATWSNSPSTDNSRDVSDRANNSTTAGSPSLRRNLFDHLTSPKDSPKNQQKQQHRVHQSNSPPPSMLQSILLEEEEERRHRNSKLGTIQHPQGSHNPTSSQRQQQQQQQRTSPIDLDETPPSSPDQSFASNKVPLPPSNRNDKSATTSRMMLAASTPASSCAGTTGAPSDTGDDEEDEDNASAAPNTAISSHYAELAMQLNNITINQALDGSFAYQQHEVRLKAYGEGPIDLDITPPHLDDSTVVADNLDPTAAGVSNNSSNTNSQLDITLPDDGSFAAPSDNEFGPTEVAILKTIVYSAGDANHANLVVKQQPRPKSSPPPMSQVQKMMGQQQRYSPRRSTPVDLDDTIVSNINTSWLMVDPVLQGTAGHDGNAPPVDLDDTIASSMQNSSFAPPHAPPPQIHRIVDLDDTIATSHNGSFQQQHQYQHQQSSFSDTNRIMVDLDATIASSTNASFQQQQYPSATGSLRSVDIDDTIASSRNRSYASHDNSMDNNSILVANNSILAGINKNGALAPIQPGDVDRTEDFSVDSNERSYFHDHRLEQHLDEALPGCRMYSVPVEDQDLDDSMGWSKNKNSFQSSSSGTAPAAPKKSAKPPRPSPRLPPSGKDSRQHFAIGDSGGEVRQSSNQNAVTLRHSVARGSIIDMIDPTDSAKSVVATPDKAIRSMSPVAGGKNVEDKLAISKSEDSTWNDVDDEHTNVDVTRNQQLETKTNKGGLRSRSQAKSSVTPQMQVIKPKPFHQRPPRPPPMANPGAQDRLSAVWEESRSRTSSDYTGPVDLDETVETSASGDAYAGPVDLDDTIDETDSGNESSSKTPLWSGFVSDSEESDGASGGVFFSKVLAPGTKQSTSKAGAADSPPSGSEDESGRFQRKERATGDAEWVAFSKSESATPVVSKVKSTAIPGKLRSPPKDTQPVAQQLAQLKSTAQKEGNWCHFDKEGAYEAVCTDNEDAPILSVRQTDCNYTAQPVKISVTDVPLATSDIRQSEAASNVSSKETTTASNQTNTKTSSQWQYDSDNCHGVPDTIDPEDSDLLQGEEDGWSAGDILQDINSESSKETPPGTQRYLSQAAKMAQPQFQKIRFKQKRITSSTSRKKFNSSSESSDQLQADDVFGVDDSNAREDSVYSFKQLDSSNDSISAATLVREEFESASCTDEGLLLTARNNQEQSYGSDTMDDSTALEIQRFRKICMENATAASVARSDNKIEIEEDDTVTSSAAGDMQAARDNYVDVMTELEKCFNISNKSLRSDSVADPLAVASASRFAQQYNDNTSGATSMLQLNESSISGIQQQIKTALAVAAEAKETFDPAKLEIEINKLRATATALRLQVEMAAQEEFDSSGMSLSGCQGQASGDGAKRASVGSHPFDKSSNRGSFSQHSADLGYNNISTDSSGNHADDEGGSACQDDSVDSFNTPSIEARAICPPSPQTSTMTKMRNELSLEFQAASAKECNSVSTPKRSNKGGKSVTKRMFGAFSRMRSSPGPVNPIDSAFHFKTSPHQQDQVMAQYKIKNKVVDQIRRLRKRNNRDTSSYNEPPDTPPTPTYSSKSEMVVYDFRKCPKSCLAPNADSRAAEASPRKSPKKSPNKARSTTPVARKLYCENGTTAESQVQLEDVFAADFSNFAAQEKADVEHKSELQFMADFNDWATFNAPPFDPAKKSEPEPFVPARGLDLDDEISQVKTEHLSSAVFDRDHFFKEYRPIPTLHEESIAHVCGLPYPSTTLQVARHSLIPDTADFTTEADDAARQHFQQEEDKMISYLLNGMEDPETNRDQNTSVQSSKEISNGNAAGAIQQGEDQTPSGGEASSSFWQDSTRPEAPTKATLNSSMNEGDGLDSSHSTSPDRHFEQLVESLLHRAVDSNRSDRYVSEDEFETAHESSASLDYSEDTLHKINNSILKVETVGFDEEFSLCEQRTDSFADRSSHAESPALVSGLSLAGNRFSRQETPPVLMELRAPPNAPRKNASKHKHSGSEGSSSFAEGTFTAIRNIMTGGLSPWDVPTIFNIKEAPGEPVIPTTKKADTSFREAQSVELVLNAPTQPAAPQPRPSQQQSPTTPHSAVSPPPKRPLATMGKSPAGVAEMDSYYTIDDSKYDNTMQLEDSAATDYSDDDSFGNGPRSLASHEQQDFDEGHRHNSTLMNSAVLKEPIEMVRSDTPDRIGRTHGARNPELHSIDSEYSYEDGLIDGSYSYSLNATQYSQNNNPLGLALYSDQAEV